MKNKNMLLVAIMLIAILSLGIVKADTVFIDVSLLTYDPIPVEPGKTMDVWINIENTGTAEAKNMKIEFLDNAAFTLISTEDRVKEISVLNAYAVNTIKYKVKVADTVPEGSNDLLIQYSFGQIKEIVNVPIDVKSTETSISINSVEINPSPVASGKQTELSLTIKNLARSSSIRDVKVNIGITPFVLGTTVTDLPFVTIGSGNQKSIDRISAGEEVIFDFNLAVYPSAESKLYKLPVVVSYYDDTGREYSEQILVGIEVNSKPDLMVNLESTDINKDVKSGNILFNVVNRGTSNIKLLTLTLMPSDQYELLTPSNEMYLGNIDSDDFETARFNINAESEDLIFKIKLDYMDSLNNKYSEIYEVKYDLKEAQNSKKTSPVMWLVLIILLAAIVIYVIRRRRKHK